MFVQMTDEAGVYTRDSQLPVLAHRESAVTRTFHFGNEVRSHPVNVQTYEIVDRQIAIPSGHEGTDEIGIDSVDAQLDQLGRSHIGEPRPLDGDGIVRSDTVNF